MADEPVRLVRCRPNVCCQAARTVHLVPMSDEAQAGAVSTLCGARLTVEEIEAVTPGEGVPCTACGCATYHVWGWPVTQHDDQVWMDLHVDASAIAIAIPMPLATKVTKVLTARHCAPAVLTHPDVPGHGIVLAGERFSAMLPWPACAHQVFGTLALPPATSPRGPIIWVQPPCKDSLLLSREIDVFGALRTVLSHPEADEDPSLGM